MSTPTEKGISMHIKDRMLAKYYKAKSDYEKWEWKTTYVTELG